MDPEPPTLDEIAAAIVAGKDIDWDAIEAAATPEVRVLLPHLRVLGRVGRVRGDQQVPLGWGPLRLLEHVGNGSFGEVYRAWDERLAREVALKLLWPNPVLDPASGSAVIAEGRRLARVRHPNVVTVYGADEIDGRVGIWMEFVRGRTLAELTREGPTTAVEDAVRVGLVLCDALAAVHRAGIVHGDVKAANVVRDEDGRLVLMDFGAGRDSAHDRIEGASAGTPLYAAPEVLAGHPATAASDIYALGVLLYHLVTRGYPVGGATVGEVHDAHREGRRARLADVWPAAPAGLASCIDRALSPRPEDRFRSASDMAAALAAALPATAAPTRAASGAARSRGSRRMTALAAAAAGVAIIAGFSVPTPPAIPSAPREQGWMLIVPLENRTGDPTTQGAVEHVLTRELSAGGIGIVDRERINGTLRLMERPPGDALDVSSGREVALRDGGIDALLTGRVDTLGGRYVVDVEIDAPGSGEVLFRATESAPDREGLVGAARRLAGQIGRRRIRREPVPSSRSLDRVATRSFRALELYTEAAALSAEKTSNTTDQWAAIAELLRSALQEDADFASAHIMRALALQHAGRPPSEFLPHAESALVKADATPEVERYFIRGAYHTLRGQPDAAVPYYQSLLRLYPNHYWGLRNLGLMYEWTGRLREAVPLAVRLADLRADDTFDNTVAAEALTMWAHQPKAARLYVDRVRAALARGVAPWRSVAWIQAFPAVEAWLDGDVAAAKAAIDTLTEGLQGLDGRDRDLLALTISHLYLSLGRLGDAEAVSGTLSETFGGPARGLASVAFAREDHALARHHLDAFCSLPYWPAGGPELGAVVGADQCVRRFNALDEPTTNPDPLRDGSQLVPGLVALRRGRTAEAERLLSVAALAQRLGGRGYVLAREGLASALIRNGKVHEGVQVLEGTDVYMTMPFRGQPSGFLWLRTRLRLADMYRTLGRTGEAEAVEQDLRLRLTVADPDHPITLALAARAGH